MGERRFMTVSDFVVEGPDDEMVGAEVLISFRSPILSLDDVRGKMPPEERVPAGKPGGGAGGHKRSRPRRRRARRGRR